MAPSKWRQGLLYQLVVEKIMTMMRRKCIVTGAKGFIGRNLLTQLLKDGWDVVTTVNSPEEDIPTDLGGVDVIFHIGANSNTLEMDTNSIMNSNYSFTKYVVDLACMYGTKVVYASSAAIYGKDNEASNILEEDGSERLLEMFDRPENLYAWTKLLGEHYGLARLESFVALRYFNVYGPGEHEKGRMASMAWHAWKAQPNEISLYEGKPRRDFVYVKDVVSATIAAADTLGGVYQVGTGIANTFESLVSGMGATYNYLAPSTPKPDGYQSYTRSDSNLWVPNWQPKYTLEQGTADYVNHIKFSGEM